MQINDTSEFVWNFLKTSTAAATFRALVTGGADNILEAGDLSIDILNAAVKVRRAAGLSTGLLAVSVQDSGEELTGVSYIRQQTVVVRLYDRGRGYRNIRAAREELISVLNDAAGGITPGHGMGTLILTYAGRGGHIWDKTFDVEYEGILFRARVMYEEAD